MSERSFTRLANTFHRLMSRRMGAALAVLGVLLPLAFVPFVDNYNRRLAFVENLASMSVPLSADSTRPDFETIQLPTPGRDAVAVGNGDFAEFPAGLAVDERAGLVSAAKLDRFPRSDHPRWWRYAGMEVVSRGARLPFRAVFVAGLVLVAVGLLIVIFVRPDHAVGRRVQALGAGGWN
jgi:hypothetical protein